MKVTLPIACLALLAAGLVGFISAVVPAYSASRVDIVDGLRHIG